MSSEERRRTTARKFLEENFGKTGRSPVPGVLLKELAKDEPSAELLGLMAKMFTHNFELWRVWDSQDEDHNARAFEVMYPPYVSTADNHFIAVADTRKELDEIVEKVFPEERREYGFIEYERYGNYYIAYD